MKPFKALYCNDITLHLINEDNLDIVVDMFRHYPDANHMLREINENYRPAYNNGTRSRYGFYTKNDNELLGLSMLEVHDPRTGIGSTGADTLTQMRGRGIAPMSKPHLFYLGFAMLGLNRIETGCLISNISSKRSIEKTLGFQLEGVMRESGLNDAGGYEDQFMYSILRRDWLALYDPTLVEVIY